MDRAFADALAALQDERAIAEMMVEAAQTTVARVAGIIGSGSAWKETGLTSKDVAAAVNKERAVGREVAVDVGARGRGFIIRFLEFGTSRDPAYPALRPGWDATVSTVKDSMIAGLRRLLPSLRGGR